MDGFTCGAEGVEDVELAAEAEGGLEVAVLVEDVLGAGAVLLPLVRPEAEPVVGRARQRRPVGAQAAQQVAHLHTTAFFSSSLVVRLGLSPASWQNNQPNKRQTSVSRAVRARKVIAYLHCNR